MYNSTFDLKKFLTVMQPMANAQMSVSDVTVIATPAWRIVFPILSPRSSVLRDFSWFLKHCTMTNMSSIPIPEYGVIYLIEDAIAN